MSLKNCELFFRLYADKLIANELQRDKDGLIQLVRQYPDCEVINNMDKICKHLTSAENIIMSTEPERRVVYQMNCLKYNNLVHYPVNV